jgi:outer membrane protein assembly factor BamA
VYEDYVHLRRNRGLGFLASYPFDKFMRVEAGAQGYLSYNEIWRLSDYWYLYNNYREQILLTNQAFVFDNTVWNDWGPYRGTRMRLESYQSTLLSSRKFYTGYFDFRNYFKLANRYTFATWLYGLGSFGKHPEYYTIGGEVVRGYYDYEFNDNPGSKVLFTSLELRHPFIDKLKIAFPLPIELNNIRGVTFLDAGMVINDSTSIYGKTTYYNFNNSTYYEQSEFQDLKIGVGVGLRMQISYFLLKLDFAKPLSTTENKGWKIHFGLGTDF